MFRVLSCLTVEHDWRLVSLACLVCFSASIVAVNIFHRAVAAHARTRLIWIAIAGGAIGYGIWATHFIAMLAYDPGIGTGYEVALTATSLIAAMAVTTVGFGCAANDPHRWGPALGGGIIGLGIATMHYVGMFALEVPGRVTWSPDLVIVSIALGVVLGVAALSAAVRLKGKAATPIAAALLTLAIVSHHFTAMGAVLIVPDPTRAFDSLYLPPNDLALAIAGVALSILGMSFIGVQADRRLAMRTDKFRKIIDALARARRQVEASQQELQAQKFWLNTAINNMSQGLVLFDSSERVVVSNQRYVDMYNLSSDVVQPGCKFYDLMKQRERAGSFKGDIRKYQASVHSDLARGETTEMLADTPDGRSIRIVNQPLPDGGWLATHEDITAQRRSEARIAYLAHHDILTGLANRVAFTHKIERAAARQRRSGEPFSVLLLDLDRFKYVNDTLGHPAGDALLREVALRLRACLRETDGIGRLGGDEFAIMQTGDDEQREAAGQCAQRVIAALAKPYDVEGTEVNIGASIGIALAPEHACEPDELLKMADMALYRAKSMGRNHYMFFDAEMTELVSARRTIENELRSAVQHGGLRLYFQPIIDAKTSRVCGAEALVRWQHPTKGLISPDQFIPLAEETGLIGRIGEWVLHAACAEAATWPSGTKVAVNLSPAQLRKADICDVVLNALAKSKLAPERLELEITERALIESGSDFLPQLRRLKLLGVAVALDDFGTGYSSLSQLTMFPFDKIKIDKSFTQNMTKRAACAAVISSTMTLANILDIAMTAEGIETEEQSRILRLAGVSSLQGYLFKRPGPAAELDFDRIYDSPQLTDAA